MEHYENRARKWAKLDLGDGYTSYANRQADMWRRLGLEGRKAFKGYTNVPEASGETDRTNAEDDPIE
jgi:hypothetical protein